MLLDIFAGVRGTLTQTAWIWAFLVAAEMAFPRTHKISFKERLRAGKFGVLYWISVGISAVLIGALLQPLQLRPLLTINYMPKTTIGFVLWTMLGTAIVVLSSDFLYYWFHRVQHTRLLWRFHSMHHGIRDLNAINYNHWTEELSRIPFMVIPNYLFVPKGLMIWQFALALAMVQSQYIHAQTRINNGRFWWLLYDNRFHRIHHSMEQRHYDKNFGVITPLWDWMFGTLYIPTKGEWPETGLVDQPDVKGIWDWLWRPFKFGSAPSSQASAADGP